MIVLVVDQNYVLAFKREGKPPISTDTHRPMTSKVPKKRVQAITGSIQIARAFCRIERCKQNSDSLRMSRLNSSLGAGFRKTLQPLMPEAANHVYSV